MDRTDRLIRKLDEARGMLQAAERRINRTILVTEEWHLKEVLAHVAVWDEVSLPPLKSLIESGLASTNRVLDIEEINSQVAAECRDLEYEQVVQRWQRSRERLKATVKEMPPEAFDVSLLFPWGRRGTAAEMVEVLARHEREHALEIEELWAE